MQADQDRMGKEEHLHIHRLLRLLQDPICCEYVPIVTDLYDCPQYLTLSAYIIVINI